MLCWRRLTDLAQIHGVRRTGQWQVNFRAAKPDPARPPTRTTQCLLTTSSFLSWANAENIRANLSVCHSPAALPSLKTWAWALRQPGKSKIGLQASVYFESRAPRPPSRVGGLRRYVQAGKLHLETLVKGHTKAEAFEREGADRPKGCVLRLILWRFPMSAELSRWDHGNLVNRAVPILSPKVYTTVIPECAFWLVYGGPKKVVGLSVGLNDILD